MGRIRYKTSAYHQALQRFQAVYWRELLRQTKGNVALASRHAGLNRTHVHRLLIGCGLRTKGGRHVGRWGGLHDHD